MRNINNEPTTNIKTETLEMEELTDKQREKLVFIDSFVKTHGYPPTQMEVAENFGVSRENIRQYLNILKKKQYLTWDKNKVRSIKITNYNF